MRSARALVVVALLAGGLTVVRASTPRFWQVSTQAAFLKGEVEGLSIDSDGRLLLGPVVRPLYEGTVPFIWTLVAGPDGAVYAGSGNDGQVFRIDRQGKASVFADTPEMEIHALAFSPDGGLYVGTSPDGKIYKVDKAGASTVFFDPDDKYIWSLAVDPQGRLYAGTGEKGLIYRITPDGKGTVFFNTRTTHVTTLAWDAGGRLLAGTESPGRVLRIDAAGKGFVLLDSPYREIHAVRAGADGAIYAAAINGKPAAGGAAPVATPEPARTAPVPSVSTEITSVTVIDAPVSAGAEPRPAREKPESGSPKGAVYRIDAGGSWEVIWNSSEDIPYDVAVDGSDAVLVGTGNAGKVYRVAGNPWRSTLLLRAGGQQVTALVALPGSRRVLATSNPAKVYDLSGDQSAQGTYTSDVKDAGMVAAWGTLSWRSVPEGAPRIQVFSRTGNTETPDDTWSPWTGPYVRADGEPVKAPPARYLQWKAVFSGTGPSPALTSVTVGYLQRNARPKITAITVQPPGIVFQRPFSSGELEIAGYVNGTADAKLPAFSMPLGATTQAPNAGPALGRRIYQKGLQAFVWRAEDDNDDRLVYDILYRRDDESAWKPLRRAYADAVLVWDTTSVPDGTYIIRVVASDLPSNPAADARSGELDSTAFEIDNTPPAIVTTAIERAGAQTRVAFEVRDAHSPIDHVEYSLDGGRWQTVYPSDGVSDAKTERYEVLVDGDAAGRVVIRAVDAMDNAANARAELPAAGGRR